MPGLHLKKPRFTYSSCEPLTKPRERIKKFKGTANSNNLDRNELDAPLPDRKDLANKTFSDKILKDRVYEIARNCKYDGYQRTLA